MKSFSLFPLAVPMAFRICVRLKCRLFQFLLVFLSNSATSYFFGAPCLPLLPRQVLFFLLLFLQLICILLSTNFLLAFPVDSHTIPTLFPFLFHFLNLRLFLLFCSPILIFFMFLLFCFCKEASQVNFQPLSLSN